MEILNSDGDSSPREKPISEITRSVKARYPIPAVSGVFTDGTILETIFRPDLAETAFAIWQRESWHHGKSFETGNHDRLVPFSADNNLIKNEVVLLPSMPEEYGTEEKLLSEIQGYIHRYVDLSPLFEKVASYYVLFSWIHDGFNELPYLRVRGDTGSGKTRFLLTVGSLCYKPIFASGASTVSPLFRILDAFHGTLIIDEGDFRFSDERAEIVKILNNGNAKGFPVLRTETTGAKKEFNPVAYHVFGPKLVATRGFFEDRALESRCLTEEMGQYRLRDDIPINLSSNHKAEALHIRNKLLLFRFRNFNKRQITEALINRAIEPRLNQIFAPLLSIIDDAKAQDDLKELARRYHRELITDRGLDTEAQLLQVIRDLLMASADGQVSVKEITDMFADRHAEEFDRKITPKWIGSILRGKLHLKTQKSHGVFVISHFETQKLRYLYEKYGISVDDNGPREDTSSIINLNANSGDIGDLGDLDKG
jgi:hypothetical protein